MCKKCSFPTKLAKASQITGMHFTSEEITLGLKKKQYTAQFPKSLQAMLKVNKTEGSNAKLNN